MFFLQPGEGRGRAQRGAADDDARDAHCGSAERYRSAPLFG